MIFHLGVHQAESAWVPTRVAFLQCDRVVFFAVRPHLIFFYGLLCLHRSPTALEFGKLERNSEPVLYATGTYCIYFIRCTHKIFSFGDASGEIRTGSNAGRIFGVRPRGFFHGAAPFKFFSVAFFFICSYNFFASFEVSGCNFLWHGSHYFGSL